MVFLLCVAPDLMCVLFGEKYAGSAVPFRIYLLLLPMRTITFGAVLQATGKSRHILISTVLVLTVNAVAGWLAVGWFGPVGAAAASVAATYLVYVPYLMGVIGSTLRISAQRMFPWAELAKLTATTLVPGAATLAVMLLFPLPRTMRLAAAGVVYGGLLLAIFVLTGRLRFLDIRTMPRMLLEAGWRRQG